MKERAAAYLSSGRPRAWTVPWQVLRILRARRAMIPKPAIYLWAAVLGIALGVAADLLLGWPWWLVAGVFVVAVALFFLSTAFWPRNLGRAPLAVELLRVVSPRRARDRDDREKIERFTTARFPLYGLPRSWPGLRFLAAWGGGWAAGRPVSTMLGLGHGDPAARDEPFLLVEVDSRPPPEQLRRRHLAEGLRAKAWAPPSGADGSEPDWDTAAIRVDAEVVTVEWVEEGDHWVATATVGTCALNLHGRGLPITSVELVQVTDLEPYIDGSQRLGRL